MRTMRPNLHLNLNPTSLVGTKSPASGFVTPIDQMHPSTPSLRSGSVYSCNSDDDMEMVTPTSTAVSKCNSFGSVASFASSMSLQDIHINYDRQFDELILQTYQSYSTRPDITPFNPRFPPSGIAHKVSKEVYHYLTKHGIRIDAQQDSLPPQNQTLMIIRKRLFELCHDDSGLTRQNSATGVSSAPQQRLSQTSQPSGSTAHKPSWLHYNPTFSLTRGSSTDSLVESVPQNIQARSSAMPLPRKQSFSQFAQFPQYAQDYQYTPPSSTDADDEFTFERKQALQSPFQESQFNFKHHPAHRRLDVSDIEVDPLYNATSQRKRDSLKLKRNMK
ncbi:unnamed protein product [Kuraishia capsulata CBS 1993]|uniref:Uncharacterized protein n=1 Tax=Kuraishia capsulata CBS 1993 TaxID=1382522 RepID=W6MUS1_9ASCO|nr:uncharacterized protein KUCA_T00001841001 [Kuraishia capsulata CBS 1993]CDK25870.1 unnamed protein product [Kuraishia capsulata CBS 1993]